MEPGVTPENTTTETTAPEQSPVLVVHKGIRQGQMCFTYCEDFNADDNWARLSGKLTPDGDGPCTILPISSIIRVDHWGGVVTM